MRAREAAATAQVDVEAALAWRDFMVSNYSDAGRSAGSRARASTCCAAPAGSPVPGVVEVDGVRHTADHVVLATGADPVVPPVPGLRELEGVWTNREATSMKAIPRRLLVLGGGRSAWRWRRPCVASAARSRSSTAPSTCSRASPARLGAALGEVLRRDGIELVLGVHATAARRDGEDYVLELDDGRELRGDRLLVATGRRPRVDGLGLETVGIEPDGHGIPVDAQLRAASALWAIGDVNGIWPLTHVGKYEGEVVAANILGEPREANYEAVPRVVYTDPQAAAVGAAEAPLQRHRAAVRGRQDRHLHPRLCRSNGFLTLLSDGERLTGAYALGPEAGEWLQQATLAIRARVPLDVLRDTIQPFPTFSEIYVAALKALQARSLRVPDEWASRRGESADGGCTT